MVEGSNVDMEVEIWLPWVGCLGWAGARQGCDFLEFHFLQRQHGPAPPPGCTPKDICWMPLEGHSRMAKTYFSL